MTASPVVIRHVARGAVLVASASLSEELVQRGITQVRRWTRGIDHWLFRPHGDFHPAIVNLPRPILLNVGRVASEKNLEAFLDADAPGTKVVVGDGPARAGLQAKFPEARFLGKKTGEALAGCYAHADVFVFPSRTDTFGLVMIEALACGTPVAAFPVAGPLDIVTDAVGALSDNLTRAIDAARYCDRAACAAYGASYSWEAATRQFLSGLVALQEQQTVSLTAAPAF